MKTPAPKVGTARRDGSQRTVLAVPRLAGIALAGWMLISTFIYQAAAVAGVKRLAHRSAWVTLPAVASRSLAAGDVQLARAGR